jgi:signal transduction histidine kinase
MFLNFGKLADTKGLNTQGTGLGLSICKNLIEKMGGCVRVESEGENKGTSFIIQLSAFSKIKTADLVKLS